MKMVERIKIRDYVSIQTFWSLHLFSWCSKSPASTLKLHGFVAFKAVWRIHIKAEFTRVTLRYIHTERQGRRSGLGRNTLISIAPFTPSTSAGVTPSGNADVKIEMGSRLIQSDNADARSEKSPERHLRSILCPRILIGDQNKKSHWTLYKEICIKWGAGLPWRLAESVENYD